MIEPQRGEVGLSCPRLFLWGRDAPSLLGKTFGNGIADLGAGQLYHAHHQGSRISVFGLEGNMWALLQHTPDGSPSQIIPETYPMRVCIVDARNRTELFALRGSGPKKLLNDHAATLAKELDERVFAEDVKIGNAHVRLASQGILEEGSLEFWVDRDEVEAFRELFPVDKKD